MSVQATVQENSAAEPTPRRRTRRRQVSPAPAAEESRPSAQQSPADSAARPSPSVHQTLAGSAVRQTVMIDGEARQIVSSNAPGRKASVDAETFIRSALKNPEDQERVAAFKKKRRRRLLMTLIWPVLFAVGVLSVQIWPSMPTLAVVAIALLIYPAIGSIISIIVSFIGSKTDKSIKHLEARGLLGRALREKEGKSHTPFGDYAVLSDHFVFRKKGPGIIIACDDILWVYTSYFRRYYSLMLGTKHLGKVTLSGVSRYKRNHKQLLSEAVSELQRRNPAILIGDTPENKAKYKTMTRK